jgi:hypothetical protein
MFKAAGERLVTGIAGDAFEKTCGDRHLGPPTATEDREKPLYTPSIGYVFIPLHFAL